MNTYICTDCGSSVDYLEVFPGPRCLDCHATIWDRKSNSEKFAEFDNLASTFRTSIN